MKTQEIRERFLRHFEVNGHTRVPSASLLVDDPNLLFVNAGMVPFKPYLLGQVTPSYRRATSVQKCVRTQDIDEVGVTTRHNTFFEMLGNFSFGDYFKEGAITLAWDLVTGSPAVGGYGIDPERIWVTVYHEDDEAAALWREITGIPPERIQRRGMADNFWSMGVPGPCGPSSEIYYDRGPEFGQEGGPIVDEDRYLEFWNLVFMQYERGPGPAKEGYSIIGELPARNIDTGMGLERVACLLQNVDNVYETDLLYPTIALTEALTGQKYGTDHATDVRFRVIADHMRSSVMLISDGVIPSNEGRGYVLRRLLRRVVRNMRLLGSHDTVMPQLVGAVRDAMGPAYSELETDFDRITSYAESEEETFAQTLRQGTVILDTAVSSAQAQGAKQLSGAQAFRLHDTYGFPIDLTLEMAAEQGLSVDEDGFRRLMAQQRDRAKADAEARKTGHGDVSAYREVLDNAGRSEFTGYFEISREARVVGLVGTDGGLTGAAEGDELEVVLDATPFYAEGGGQQPDTGIIRLGNGELEVLDVQSPIQGLIAHRVKVRRGEVRPGDSAFAEVDVARRRSISRAHTATHLIHRAMRGALGESATQAGSLNAPGRLRFDFNTPGAVPTSVLADVEAEVNAILQDDLEVRAFVTSQDEARRIGAMALFGEKYGDEVRVVEVGEYARELCGGTHAARSGQVGLVKLLSESSIGSGVRRVEALVGLDAFNYLAREHVLVSQLAEAFKAPPEQVGDRVHATLERLRAVEKELEQLRSAQVLAGAGMLASRAHDVHGVAVVATQAPQGLGGNDLRGLALEVRNRLDPGRPGVVALISQTNGAVAFVATVNDVGQTAGLSANDVVQALAPPVLGRGGGKADMAQGGGSNSDGISDALTAVEQKIATRAINPV